MTSMRRIALVFGIIVCCVSCDQVSKRAAAIALEGRPSVSLVCDTIRFSYDENAGAFLSLGESLPPRLRLCLFLLFPAIAITGVLIFAVRHRAPDWLEVAALSLLAAGGLGNLVDRALYGVVRDFMNVGIGSLRTGVFNLADVTITAGVLLLLARHYVVRRSRPTTRQLLQ